MLYVVKGRVSAGIDLKQLTPDSISMSPDQKTIYIQLPPAQIFHRYVDSGTTYTLKSGILSGSDLEFADSLHEEAKVALLQAACEQNILAMAHDNAKKELENLFQMIELNVVFQPSTVKEACQIA